MTMIIKSNTATTSTRSRASIFSRGFLAAGLAFTLSVATASAGQFEPRTQPGVGLFDQGGELHGAAKRDENRAERQYGYPGVVSNETVNAVGQRDRAQSAVPADNARNEPGQGMFDIQR
jgi:hypothetical protein